MSWVPTQTWREELQGKWFIWKLIPVRPGRRVEMRQGWEKSRRPGLGFVEDFREIIWNKLKVIYSRCRKDNIYSPTSITLLRADQKGINSLALLVYFT